MSSPEAQGYGPSLDQNNMRNQLLDPSALLLLFSADAGFCCWRLLNTFPKYLKDSRAAPHAPCC
jgi:hypothetical protein